MFNNKWFIKHQDLLLWLANSWIGKRILRINGKRSSVGKNKIIKIIPNAIFWDGKKGETVAEFRGHNKFTKRIYHAFYPVWWLMHQWDAIFANNFKPAWNLGFDSLTVFPVAGQNEPADGDVRRASVDEAWGTLRGGAGTQGFPSGSTIIPYLYSTNSPATGTNWEEIDRAVTMFDTSSLGSGASISAAVLSIASFDAGGTKSDGHSATENVTVVDHNTTGTDDIVSGDYALAKFGTTEFVDTRKSFADWSDTDNVYNDFTLNSSGRGNISLTAITHFGLMGGKYDFDNSTPNRNDNTISFVRGRSADTSGTSADPKLVITFTVSTGGFMTTNRGVWGA